MTFIWSGFQGSLGTLHVWKWIDLDVVHVVAPMAHRGPGASEIGKCKECWSLVAPGAQWGHIVHRLAICIIHWYEVAPRIGDINVWKWIYIDVVHILASMAHMRPRTFELTKCKGCWNLVSPGAQWGHIMHRMAICIWHWYEVAPKAHWGRKTSENG